MASSSNGREALEQLAKEPCDVMVTDLRMCDVDGIQLMEAAGSSSPGTLVIWLTAYGCEGLQEEVARLGVRRCISKPAGTSDIVRTVREALGNALGSGQVSMREARNVASYRDVERMMRKESPWTLGRSRDKRTVSGG